MVGIRRTKIANQVSDYGKYTVVLLERLLVADLKF